MFRIYDGSLSQNNPYLNRSKVLFFISSQIIYRLLGIDVSSKEIRLRVMYGAGAMVAASTIMASGIIIASKI